VVDDGSKDNTVDVVRSFESAGVRVVSQKNQGAAAARNTAFSLCRGDYIQWLDADDLLSPDKISRQMAALGENPNTRIVLSSAWGRFMHRPRRAEFVPSPLWCDLSPGEWFCRYMENNVYMQTATWLVSREVTEAAGPWDIRLLGDDDGEYFSRVLLASDRTQFVPEAKVYYRMSGAGSLSYIGSSDKKKDAQWLSMKLHIQYLRSLDDSIRARTACVTYMQNWMTFFYPERLDIFEQASQLAQELGGQLKIPQLPWKYSPIQSIFGWRAARRAQKLLPRVRWSLYASWDRALSQIGTHKQLSSQGLGS
jgi:glycosyltransferase involved in cell wall biosynthesis